jgi:serine/threonine-protein kinase
MPSINLSNELINHFRIEKYEIANTGGQKKVFAVTIDGLKFALKIINIADERFEREVKICERFSDNSGIPKILKIEQYDGDTIILEEFIEGDDLSSIYGNYKDQEEKVCNLIYDIGVILEPVWNARYVHRDLKPQNIRIKQDGKPVVLDFGIARALDEDSITITGGQQPLSWLFASPEQYSGRKELISYRTDFFCLGIIAYYLYSGTLPFGNTKTEIEENFVKGVPEIELNGIMLDKFCKSSLKINPSERPRTIETFLKMVKI